MCARLNVSALNGLCVIVPLVLIALALCVINQAGPVSAFAENPCHGTVKCLLGDRSYHVREPHDWDGKTPLPVLFHFHGWARQGDLVVVHRRIASATVRRGVLLVAPNGLCGTWDFWQANSSDVSFAAEVLQDIARHYPIDQARIYVSGYSYGGAMAWRFACDYDGKIAALLAVSGSINQNENCLYAPNEVRHVHGLKDTVMSFPVGPKGDKTYPVALWRDRLSCGSGRSLGSWQARAWLTFERRVWESCRDGLVVLDIHSGGHFIPHGWIARQLDELLKLPFSYP